MPPLGHMAAGQACWPRAWRNGNAGGRCGWSCIQSGRDCSKDQARLRCYVQGVGRLGRCFGLRPCAAPGRNAAWCASADTRAAHERPAMAHQFFLAFSANAPWRAIVRDWLGLWRVWSRGVVVVGFDSACINVPGRLCGL